MRDGSYYEGSFFNGEISGRGVKYFAYDGQKYTGDFSCGEASGEGVVEYKDGSTYEGQFENNRREGYGVLTSEKGTYEGQFHNNLCHGDGLYRYRNGDIFTGYWVQGKKQGHGKVEFNNGATYEGQWRADKYNGEGELKDISGVTYSGLWSYHVPSFNPVRLAVAIPEGTPVENLSVGDENLNLFAVTLPQGEAFTLDVSVVTADGEVVTQIGGLQLAAKALYKYRPQPPEFKEPLLEIIQQTEMKVEPTPLYDAVSYPVTDYLEFIREVDKTVNIHLTQQANSKRSSDKNVSLNIDKPGEPTSPLSPYPPGTAEDTGIVPNKSFGAAVDNFLSTQQGKNDELSNPESNRSTNRDAWTAPSAQTQLVHQGQAQFAALVLPSAPAGYRPQEIEDFLEQRRATVKISTFAIGGTGGIGSSGSSVGIAGKKQTTEVNYSRLNEPELKKVITSEKSARPGKGASILTTFW
ncbi:uncharacterized protein LOC142355905 isoform X2 [Convolutriloba macropyga]|uniref:uncharacterized protein LOC142355905 isoform X2 n=1 Tax=Convolutriloba macropyga TaxID=536237 RepID=UPI003F524D5E